MILKVSAHKPLRAIRKKCLECSGGSSTEVKLCSVTKCPLYEFRSGQVPESKADSTETTKDA